MSPRSRGDRNTPWTSSAADSPASPLPWLADELARLTSGGSGPSASEPLGHFGPDGRYSRTSLALFPSTEAERLGMCSEDWPASGMLRGGFVYPLPTSGRRTGGTGSGSSPAPWKTPTANEDAAGGPNGQMQVMLANEVRRFREGLPAGGTVSPSAGPTASSDSCRDWPTPTVPNGGRVNPPGTSVTGITPDGQKKQMDLGNVAKDWSTRTAKLTLNPAFVAWLMGWPRDSALLTLPWSGRRTRLPRAAELGSSTGQRRREKRMARRGQRPAQPTEPKADPE